MVSIAVITGLIVMFLWGVAGFMMTVPVKKIGTLKTQFLSNTLAIIPLILVLLTSFDLLIITNTNLFLLLIAGVLMVLGIYSYYKGIEIGGDVSVLSPVQGSYSIITVILSVLILKESFSFLKSASIVLIFLGIFLTSTNLKKLKQLRTTKGIKYGLIALVCLGIQFFILGVVSKETTLFGLYSTSTHYMSVYFFTTIINPGLFILFALIKKEIPTLKEIKMKEVYPVILITYVMFAVAWIVLNYGLAKDQVSLLVPISSLNPAITVILAVIFYKEKLVFNQKLGILVVLAGLFLISL